MFFRKDKTKECIDEIWDDDYYIVAAGDDAPSKQRVLDVSKSVGVILPSDYLLHAVGRMGGLYIEVRDEIWPKPKEFDVGPFWSFCYGIYSFAYSEEAPDWLRIDTAINHEYYLGKNVLPVLKVCGDADVYCLNSKGKMVRYDHETGEFNNIEMTFIEALKYELEELSLRKEQKKNS